MKHFHWVVLFALVLPAPHAALAQDEAAPSAAEPLPPPPASATPAPPTGEAPYLRAKMKQTPPMEKDALWKDFNRRLDLENAKFREMHPDWPVDESAPHHIIKKAFVGMAGKDFLEAVRQGVAATREQYKDAPEEERNLQIELLLERTLEFYPLVETNPRGHENLFSLISSVNTDQVYRLYLINRCYRSGVTENLFTLYLHDWCREYRAEVIGRMKNIILGLAHKSEVQEAAIYAIGAIVREDITDTLAADREVQRLAAEENVQIGPHILRDYPKLRLSSETREKISRTLTVLDNVFAEVPGAIRDGAVKSERVKEKLLDLIEDSVKNYDLGFAQQHLAFLAEQGRGSAPASAVPASAPTPPAPAVPAAPETTQDSRVISLEALAPTL